MIKMIRCMANGDYEIITDLDIWIKLLERGAFII
jgi:hypothetical protein